jgi:quercetin dioxygenase-like cupin family protein
MLSADIRILGPRDGDSVDLGMLGVRFMVGGELSGGGFSLVEHPIAPRGLAAPRHRHSREDEYSYVLEGQVGVELGGQVMVGEPGELIFKPRNEWHTFWNAGDEPARLLEIISPAGFERYFAEIAEVLASGPRDPARLAPLWERYGLEMDPSSVPELVERHGLVFPGA